MYVLCTSLYERLSKICTQKTNETRAQKLESDATEKEHSIALQNLFEKKMKTKLARKNDNT